MKANVTIPEAIKVYSVITLEINIESREIIVRVQREGDKVKTVILDAQDWIDDPATTTTMKTNVKGFIKWAIAEAMGVAEGDLIGEIFPQS